MHVTLTDPSINTEELPSDIRPIVGVSTSNITFGDWFPGGPVNTPTRVTRWDDFVRVFGRLHTQSAASHGVLQYFQHGGAVAWVAVNATFLAAAADSPVTMVHVLRAARIGATKLGQPLPAVPSAEVRHGRA